MICGVDEAGRGPVLGPLVVAGVKLKDESVLKPLNVRDSKKVQPKRREELFDKITEVASGYEIIIVPAEEIDILRESMTLNMLEAKIFATVIERLEPDIAYVDAADTREQEFANQILRELKFKPEIISKHGADDIYPVVSAASILAKVTRDREIKKIREEIGQDIGSGYPSDQKTIGFLENWIREKGILPPHTRKSWKTAVNIVNKIKTKSLDDFQ